MAKPADPHPDPHLHSQHVLTQEELAAIGAVAVESTYVETKLAFVIQKLCKFSRRQFNAVFGDTRLAARVELFRDLAHEALIRNLSARTELAGLVAEIMDSNAKRNRIIHDAWVDASYMRFRTQWVELDTGKQAVSALRLHAKKHPRRYRSFPIKDVMGVAHDLSAAFTNLERFSQKYLGVEPWQKRFR